MTEEKRTETMISQENQNETVEVMEFLKTLDESERKEFLAFLRGAKFVKRTA